MVATTFVGGGRGEGDQRLSEHLVGKMYITFLPEIESEFLRLAVGSRRTSDCAVRLFVIPSKILMEREETDVGS